MARDLTRLCGARRNCNSRLRPDRVAPRSGAITVARRDVAPPFAAHAGTPESGGKGRRLTVAAALPAGAIRHDPAARAGRPFRCTALQATPPASRAGRDWGRPRP